MPSPNWTNRTMWTGDNLDIMRGMNSESVDLIYLDPPCNSNRNYVAPIGNQAAGRRRPGLAWCGTARVSPLTFARLRPDSNSSFPTRQV